MDKISKKEMNEVQGGGYVTDMSCSNCGYRAAWLGEFYYQHQTYECPSCHNMTLTAVGFHGDGPIGDL